MNLILELINKYSIDHIVSLAIGLPAHQDSFFKKSLRAAQISVEQYLVCGT